MFGRISVKHINREMAKEGIFPPVWDKGIGGVTVGYSMIMVFSKLKPIIVDFEEVYLNPEKGKSEIKESKAA